MFKFSSLMMLLVFSFSSFAEIVNFDIAIKYETKNITKTSHATIAAKLGSKFSIDQEDFKADFVASQYVDKNGMMKQAGEALMIEGKLFDKINGKEQLVSSPKIITLYENEAILSSVDEKTGELIELKIRPSKKL